MPNDTSQLDPSIVALMSGLKSVEGANGNYNAVGDEGTAAGIGQWSNQPNGKVTKLGAGQIPSNFQADASQYGLSPTDFSPENQNKVMYASIAADKKNGLSPEQILSKWNSGRANAYLTDPVESSGVSATGTENVASYVKRAMAAAQAYSQKQQGFPQTNYNPQPYSNPSGNGASQFDFSGLPTVAGADQGETFTGDLSQGNFGGAALKGAEDVGNFIAPAIPDIYNDITGQNTKTGLQQAGDVGSTLLSALALIPGLGPEALAAKAGLIGTEGLGLAGKIGVNAALGAGFGASNALGAGETDPGQIAKSGLLGGAVGGGLGAAGEAIGGALSKFGGATGESRLGELISTNKTLQRSVANESRGATDISGATNPAQTLLSTAGDDGKPLSALLRVGAGGRVDATGITNQEGTGALDSLINQHADDATALVQSMKGTVPVSEFKAAAENAIRNDPGIRGTLSVPKALSNLDSKIASAQMSYGDELPYTAIDEIRKGMNKVYNPEERDVARVIGDTSRNLLYNGDGANAALKTTMANEAELIRARNFAEKLHGTVVKGGRLGKYVAQGLGDAAGAGVGSAIGGPLGAAGGGLVGAGVGNYVADAAQKSYFNPLTSRILAKLPIKTVGKLANVGILKSVR